MRPRWTISVKGLTEKYRHGIAPGFSLDICIAIKRLHELHGEGRSLVVVAREFARRGPQAAPQHCEALFCTPDTVVGLPDLVHHVSALLPQMPPLMEWARMRDAFRFTPNMLVKYSLSAFIT